MTTFLSDIELRIVGSTYCSIRKHMRAKMPTKVQNFLRTSTKRDYAKQHRPRAACIVQLQSTYTAQRDHNSSTITMETGWPHAEATNIMRAARGQS